MAYPISFPPALRAVLFALLAAESLGAIVHRQGQVPFDIPYDPPITVGIHGSASSRINPAHSGEIWIVEVIGNIYRYDYDSASRRMIRRPFEPDYDQGVEATVTLQPGEAVALYNHWHTFDNGPGNPSPSALVYEETTRIKSRTPSGRITGETEVETNSTHTYTLTEQDADSWTWVVTRPDGSTPYRVANSTSHTLRYSFEQGAGTYVIAAILTSDADTADATSLTVTAQIPGPTGMVSGTDAVKTDSTHTYTLSANNATSWIWTVSKAGAEIHRGPSGTALTLAYTFVNGAGDYVIGAELTGEGGSADASPQTVTAQVPGPGGTVAGVTSVEVYASATFTLTPENATSWVWTVDKGSSEIHRSSSGTAFTLEYTFAGPGIYTIGVELTGPGGTTDVTIRIVVTADPAGSVSGPTPVEVGSFHTYTLTPRYATSWRWVATKDGSQVRRDALTTDTTFGILFDRGAGDYVIGAELFDESDGSGDATPLTVTVQTPGPTGLVRGASAVKTAAAHAYTLTSTHADSWVWIITRPDGTTHRPGSNDSRNLEYTFASGPGNYSIGAELTGPGGTGAAVPQAVTVSDLPRGEVDGAGAVRTDSTHGYDLVAQDTDSWVWVVTLPNGSIDRPGGNGSTTLTYTFDSGAGTYMIGAELTGPGGTGAATPKTVTVQPPAPTGEVDGAGSVKTDSTHRYDLVVQNADSWVWVVTKAGTEVHRGNATTIPNLTYTFVDGAGDYSIGAELTGPGGSGAATAQAVTASATPILTGTILGETEVETNSRHAYTLDANEATTSWRWVVTKADTQLHRDPSPGTADTFEYTFADGPGVYKIGAELFGEGDATGNATDLTVTATDPVVPPPPGSVSGPGSVDTDSTHDYTLTATHADSWVWEVTRPDGTTHRPGGNDSRTLSYTFDSGEGDYSIGAALTGAGGTGAATPQAVTASDPPPGPSGSVSGPGSVDTDSTHDYTLAATHADSWVWEVTLPDDTIDRPGSNNLRTLSYRFDSGPGEYEIGVELTGPGGTADVTIRIVVTSDPTGLVSGPSPVDVGSRHNYTLTHTHATSWVWVVDKDGSEIHRSPSGTALTLSYTFANGAGEYSIGAALTGDGGTGAATPKEVTATDPVVEETWIWVPRWTEWTPVTAWAPDPFTVPQGMAFTQTRREERSQYKREVSNLGRVRNLNTWVQTQSREDTRQSTGTRPLVEIWHDRFRWTDWAPVTDWAPPRSTYAPGIRFTQTRQEEREQYKREVSNLGNERNLNTHVQTEPRTASRQNTGNGPPQTRPVRAANITRVFAGPAIAPSDDDVRARGGNGSGAWQWEIFPNADADTPPISWTTEAWTPPSVGTWQFRVRRASSGSWAHSPPSHGIPYTITVTRAPTTFAAAPVRFTHDGTEQGPTVTSTPAGATYSSSGTASATEPGEYVLSLEATGNYTGSADIAWGIDAPRIPVTFTLAPASFVYDGTRRRPTITATPADAGFAVTGTATATDAGTYTATATATGNHVGTADLSWEITRAPVTFTWRNLESPYEDGRRYLAIARRSPNVPLISRARTRRYGPAVGTYPVSVEAGDRNHHGASTAQARVTGAPATFAAAPLQFVHDGTQQGPAITATPADAGFAVTGTATAADAGSYTVTVTATGNHVGTADFVWSIDPAPVGFTLDPATFVYDGSEHAPTITPSPADATWTASGEVRATDAGDHVATATADGNYAGTADLPWTIERAPVGFTLDPATFTYDGTVHEPVITPSPADATWSAGGDVRATDAGSYMATPVASGNYAGTTSLPWEIEPAPVSFTLDPATFTYDGAEQGPAITVTPADATFAVTGTTTATDAGSYMATPVASGNYAGTADLPWEIERAPVTFTLDPATFTYDGTEQEPAITPSPADATWSASGQVRAIDAGDHVATATATGNYTGTADLPWTIERAPVRFTASPLRFTYDGAEQGPAITPTPAEATFAITGVERATDAGTYVAKATAGGNHAGVADLPWTIHPARPPPVTLAPGDGTVPVNTTVTFTATGGQGPHRWGGDLDLRHIAPGSRQALSFPDPGTFDVTVQTRAERNWLASNVATSTMTVLGGPLLSLEGDRDLGAVRVDQGTPQIVERDFTFLSSGSEPITITAIAVHDSSAIAITSGQDVGDGVTLQPGETHAFTVRFDPDARGDEIAALRVVTAELGLRQQTLHGRGEQGLLEVRWGEARSTLTAAPNENLQTRHPPGHQTWFEAAGLPGAPSPAPVSRYLDVHLRNAGNADLDLGAMTIAGDGADFAVASHANSLSPDEEIRATLTFTPSAGATGDRVADLTITADGVAASHSLLGYADDGGVVDPAISVGLVGPAASLARPNAEIFPSDDLTIQVHARANLGSLTRYRLRVHAPGAAQPGPWTVVESGPAAASVLASSHEHVAGATPGIWRVEAEALHRNGRIATAWMDFVVEGLLDMPQ